MAIASSTKLGSYEILEPLGAGGMGKVSGARDTRLNRMVAIKVMPEKFASDEPLWSRTGDEIIFESRNKMMIVPVEIKPTFKAGAPRVLFEGSSFIGMPPKNNADLSPDGKKIIIVQSSENLFVPKQINVYLHFADWVAKLVPPAPQ